MNPTTTILTDWQMQQRSKRLTASDMAAVMGLSKYASAADVWLVKTGQAERTPAGEAAEWGNRLQDAVLDWGAEQLETTIVRNQWRTGSHPILGATCDAITAPGEPLEAKTAGLMHYRELADWGEAGTDVIPDEYVIQVHVQMICTGAQMAHVAAMLAGRGPRLYHVKRHPVIVQSIEDAAGEFWRHVEQCTPPPDSVPHLDTLRGIKGVDGKSIEVPARVLADFHDAKQVVRAAESKLEEAEAALKLALGDAVLGECPGWKCRYTTIRTNRLDKSALEAAQPDLVKQFTKPSEYRRLTVSRNEEGK